MFSFQQNLFNYIVSRNPYSIFKDFLVLRAIRLLELKKKVGQNTVKKISHISHCKFSKKQNKKQRAKTKTNSKALNSLDEGLLTETSLLIIKTVHRKNDHLVY